MGLARRKTVMSSGRVPRGAAAGLAPAKATELTHRYLAAKGRSGARTVQGVVVLGEILEEGLRTFRNSYLRWLQFLGELNTTASRYRHIARLAREDRRLLNEWAFLGTSKIYWIARLPRDARTRLLSPFKKAALTQMTEAAFRGVVRPLLPRRNTSAERTLCDLQRRITATHKALRAPLPRGAAPQVRRRLAKALQGLEAAARHALRRIA